MAQLNFDPLQQLLAGLQQAPTPTPQQSYTLQDQGMVPQNLGNPIGQLHPILQQVLQGIQDGSQQNGGIGGNPLQQILGGIPTSKGGLVAQGAMALAPGLAGVASKYAPELKQSLHEIINSRNSMYHATDVQGFKGILGSGEIIPYGDNFASGVSVGDPGVSVSRVPRVASKGDKSISLVLDPDQIPDSRPFTEPDYQKSINRMQRPTDPGSQTLTQKAWVLSNGAQVQNLNKADQFNAYMDYLKGLPEAPKVSIPNNRFEFENRTYNTPVGLQAVKGVVVDKRALKDAIDRDPTKHWPPNIPQPAISSGVLSDPQLNALTDYHIGQIQQAAQSKGIPVRVAENGRDLHSYRAGFSRMKSQGQALWGLAPLLGLLGIGAQQSDQKGTQ
jgi:hypothetical protein